MEPIVLVHAGSGSPAKWSDGCTPSAEACADALRRGVSALDAAVAAVRVKEEGASAQDAAERTCALFPPHQSFGVIAVPDRDAGVASNPDMAAAIARP